MLNKQILIVEDELLIADSIERSLRREGYGVSGIAISYDDALKIIQDSPPDLALLDIRLNGKKSGIDLAHYIQDQLLPIPFIYLTSQTDRRHIDAAKATYPAGYLSKPIQKGSLMATIAITLHQQSSVAAEGNQLTLADGHTRHVIDTDDILYLQVQHIYVRVYMKGGKEFIHRSSLKEILDELPPTHFLQTHRSFAINMKAVSRWDQQYIYVQQEKAIPISRSRRKEVLASLEE